MAWCGLKSNAPVAMPIWVMCFPMDQPRQVRDIASTARPCDLNRADAPLVPPVHSARPATAEVGGLVEFAGSDRFGDLLIGELMAFQHLVVSTPDAAIQC